MARKPGRTGRRLIAPKCRLWAPTARLPARQKAGQPWAADSTGSGLSPDSATKELRALGKAPHLLWQLHHVCSGSGLPVHNPTRTCVKRQHSSWHTVAAWEIPADFSFIIHIICSPSAPPPSPPPLLCSLVPPLSFFPNPQACFPRRPAQCQASARLRAMAGGPWSCRTVSPCATLDPGQDTSALLFPS